MPVSEVKLVPHSRKENTQNKNHIILLVAQHGYAVFLDVTVSWESFTTPSQPQHM